MLWCRPILLDGILPHGPIRADICIGGLCAREAEDASRCDESKRLHWQVCAQESGGPCHCLASIPSCFDPNPLTLSVRQSCTRKADDLSPYSPILRIPHAIAMSAAPRYSIMNTSATTSRKSVSATYSASRSPRDFGGNQGREEGRED